MLFRPFFFYSLKLLIVQRPRDCRPHDSQKRGCEEGRGEVRKGRRRAGGRRQSAVPAGARAEDERGRALQGALEVDRAQPAPEDDGAGHGAGEGGGHKVPDDVQAGFSATFIAHFPGSLL